MEGSSKGKNRLFIPQDTLDQWVDEESAFVEADELTFTSDGRIYRLATAVRFLREASGAGDPHDLIGRVKEETKLAIMGADAYMDSVILDENAYDVQRGFVAVPALEASHEAALMTKVQRASQMPPAASPPDEDEQDPAFMDTLTLSREELTSTAQSPLGAPATAAPEPEKGSTDWSDEEGDSDDEESDELARFLLKSLK